MVFSDVASNNQPQPLIRDDAFKLNQKECEQNALTANMFDTQFWLLSPDNITHETTYFQNKPVQKLWKIEMKSILSLNNFRHSNRLFCEEETRFETAKIREKFQERDDILLRRIFVVSRMICMNYCANLDHTTYFDAVDYFDRVLADNLDMTFDYMMNLAAASIYIASKEQYSKLKIIREHVSAYHNSRIYSDCIIRVKELSKNYRYIFSASKIFSYSCFHMSQDERIGMKKYGMKMLRLISIHPYYLKYPPSVIVASIVAFLIGPTRGEDISRIKSNKLYDCCCDIDPFRSFLEFPFKDLAVNQFNALITLNSVVRLEMYELKFKPDKVKEEFNRKLLDILRIWLIKRY